MAGKTDGGSKENLLLSNLVWQLKLQGERQLGIKDSLRDLLGDPARLERVLTEAESRGDAALRRLASDIRAQQHAARIMHSRTKPPVPAWLWFAVVVLVAAGAAWLLYGNRAGAPRAAGCSAAAAAAAPVSLILRLHGSNTIGEKLAPALAEAYLKLKGAAATQEVETAADEHQVLSTAPVGGSRLGIEVYAHGSATAFKDLGAQATDLGMASRRVKPGEAAQLAPVDGDLTSPSSEHVLGLDGVAVIVNPANPVQSLSIEQAGKIFSGEISDWSAVGGAPGSIAIFARDDKSGTYDTFKALVLDPLGLKLLPAAHRYESSSDLSDAVSADASGIGFIGLPYVRRSKVLGISAGSGNPPIVPTQFTVGTEDYPLSRRLYLYLPGKTPSKEAADFVEYALSDAGQDVVKQIGFVCADAQCRESGGRPVLARGLQPDGRWRRAPVLRLPLRVRRRQPGHQGPARPAAPGGLRERPAGPRPLAVRLRRQPGRPPGQFPALAGARQDRGRCPAGARHPGARGARLRLRHPHRRQRQRGRAQPQPAGGGVGEVGVRIDSVNLTSPIFVELFGQVS